ncbi:exonuclease [environmental Halophage eHP-11]|nr:exonuclease [environmental Halophage eHP-11]
MTNRCMIDIETLGRSEGAAIVELGACCFDAGGVGKTFDESICLVSCQDHGLEIDAETLEWWLSQDSEARECLVGGRPLEAVLSEFNQWYDADEVWARSPVFDCNILTAAYHAVGMSTPWEFWETRDQRTLTNLHEEIDTDRDGIEHRAVDDAVYQATVAAGILTEMEAGDE